VKKNVTKKDLHQNGKGDRIRPSFVLLDDYDSKWEDTFKTNKIKKIFNKIKQWWEEVI